jgi:hypothetical protein
MKIKTIKFAVILALIASPVLPALSYGSLLVSNSAAIAADAGVSQAELQAGNAYFNADAASNGAQDSQSLRVGNPLAGQSQVQNSLANTQTASALSLNAAIARYLGLYQTFYGQYQGYLRDASAASASYSACVAAKGKNCLSNAGYYDGLANKAYGQYQYYYNLWDEDFAQQQAMLSTGGTQEVLSGSSAQTEIQDNNAYNNAQATMSANAATAAADTQAANANNNSTGVATGNSSAQTALAAIQQTTGVQQNNGTAPVVSAISALQCFRTPTATENALQSTMDSTEQAALQNAQTAVIQSQVADNRAADGLTATAQANADGAAGSVAPTAHSGAMWQEGSSAANGTANLYNSDAAQTMASATAAQTAAIAEQNTANADGANLAQQYNAQAEAAATAAAQSAGVSITATPNSVNTAIANTELASGKASTAAESAAITAYSDARVATDDTGVAATDAQAAQSAYTNAQASAKVPVVGPALKKTWDAVAGSYGGSASSTTTAANSASNAENSATQTANADNSKAESLAGSQVGNNVGTSSGDSAAQAVLAQIQKNTGVAQQ